jgi:putative endonuclease
MTQQNKKFSVGKRGEDLAAEYLQKQGFKILQRNFHTRWAELDIIAIEQDTLVFVEVKTRTNSKFGLSREAVSPFKLRTLIRSAQLYQTKFPNLPPSSRIDLVAIDIIDDKVSIELIRNITQ